MWKICEKDDYLSKKEILSYQKESLIEVFPENPHKQSRIFNQTVGRIIIKLITCLPQPNMTLLY